METDYFRKWILSFLCIVLFCCCSYFLFLLSVIKGDPSMEEGDKVLVSGDGKYYTVKPV